MGKYIKQTAVFIFISFLVSCGAGRVGRDAIIAHQIGEYHKAIERYRKATRKEKDRNRRRDYAYATGECYHYIGDYERAALYYRNAIRRGHDDPKALLNLAEMLRSTQDYEGAIETYRQYLELVPGDERAQAGLEATALAS